MSASDNVRTLETAQQSEAQLSLYSHWLDPTRTVILALGDDIIAERDTLTEYALVGGNSMSKSVTSLAVGLALCNGNIQSLDDSAQVYAHELEGTTRGQTTIRQLLMMSSAHIQLALASTDIQMKRCVTK